MTSPMNTDVAAQAASAQKIQTTADELQALLGQMQSEVDATTAVWKGGAHTAFLGGSGLIHVELQKGQTAMQDVSIKTGKTGVGYSHTDTGSAQALSNTGL